MEGAASDRPLGAKHHVRPFDGLRAIAIVSVVLFHLQLPGFEAGYLGVDVFFVLSGFLITSLLMSELEHGGIALAAFWSRRIRRLLPALAGLLLVVALVTSLTATFIERASIRGDLLASIAYVSNWRFISTSSYFANTGVESSLQHTWALSVEAQFYVVWPLLLVGAMTLFHRVRLSTMFAAAAGILASTIAMVWLYEPGAVERAYMGTDARIFEPLVGALGAVLVATPPIRERLAQLRRPMLWVGAIVMLAGMVLLRPGEPLYFHGGALAFTLATLVIVVALWDEHGGWTDRVLSWGPIAWVGALSYGIYLWHWPIILWLGVRDPGEPRRVLLGTIAVILTMAAASLSYYLMERPIRRGGRGTEATRGWRRQRPWVALALMPLVLIVVASFSVATTRVPPPPPGTPVMMLVGDSVPERLAVDLEREVSSRGWRMALAAHGGCSVTGETNTDTNGVPLHEANACADVIVAEQDHLIHEVDPDVVLWWDRWVLYDFQTAEGEHVRTGTPRFWSLRRAGLEEAVRRLTSGGARIAFVGIEPPGAAICGGRPVEKCGERLLFRVERYHDITSTWNTVMRRYAARNPELATYVDIAPEVCREVASPCDDRIRGVAARPDGTHYEGVGAELVSKLLTDAVAPWMPPVP